MIKSMTGFGKSEFEINNKKFTLEIKSLNSKQMDINARIPALYREKEIQIRKTISDALMRGKVDFNIYVENLGEESSSKINEPILKNYFNHLKSISNDLGVAVNEATLHNAMRLPDTVKVEYEKLDEGEWKVILEHIKKAIDDLNEFRIQEGKALKADISSNVKKIHEMLPEIEPHEKKRVEVIKARIQENLESLKLNGDIDSNRFEQELLFYLEKLDINEEKVRLSNHCLFFEETINLEIPVGKKLGFISQELGRDRKSVV